MVAALRASSIGRRLAKQKASFSLASTSTMVSWEGHRFCFAKAHLSASLGNRKTLFFYFARFLERTNPTGSRPYHENKINPFGVCFIFVVSWEGLEPSTLCLRGRCSNQLSYQPSPCVIGTR